MYLHKVGSSLALLGLRLALNATATEKPSSEVVSADEVTWGYLRSSRS